MTDICPSCWKPCPSGALTTGTGHRDPCCCEHPCLVWRGETVCRVTSPCATGRRDHVHVFEAAR